MKCVVSGSRIKWRNMSEQQTSGRSFALLFEQYAPIGAAIATFGALIFFDDQVAAKFAAGDWMASDLYAAIFDWSAIQTGFAFGVYGFVAGRQDGFAGALQGTIAMGRFMSYIKRANIAGFVLTFFSIPLIVLSPNITVPMSFPFISIVIWFSLFVWAFCSFLRLAFNFGKISSVKERKFYGA